jgi:hypothetical protein
VMYDRDRIENVSEALSLLRYSEMLDLGRRLFDLAVDREEFSTTKLSSEAFAALLSDWSQAVEEEIDAAEESGE